MSWLAIARKDLRDAVRWRTLWLLVGAFLLVLFVPVLAFPGVVAPSVDGFVAFTVDVVGLFVPLVSILLGYKAVVGERESGSIKLLLSAPHTRLDLAIGKFVGRSVVFALALLVGMLAAGVAVTVQLGTLPVARYAALALATLAFGLAFLALTLGFSMATPSSRRVTGAAIGAYILFAMLWDGLIRATVLVLFRFMDPQVVFDLPDWALFLKFLAPGEAYNRLVDALFDLGVASAFTGADAPWVVAVWMAPVVLLGWVVVPLALGYVHFAVADL